MEVELHDVGPSTRPPLKGRLDNYRKELTRLRKEFVSRTLVGKHPNQLAVSETNMYDLVFLPVIRLCPGPPLYVKRECGSIRAKFRNVTKTELNRILSLLPLWFCSIFSNISKFSPYMYCHVHFNGLKH